MRKIAKETFTKWAICIPDEVTDEAGTKSLALIVLSPVSASRYRTMRGILLGIQRQEGREDYSYSKM